MAVYWLSFRLARNATYEDRYDALVDTVLALKRAWWHGTPSFFLFRSDEPLDTVLTAIEQAIDPSTDTVMIGRAEPDTCHRIGNPSGSALHDWIAGTTGPQLEEREAEFA